MSARRRTRRGLPALAAALGAVLVAAAVALGTVSAPVTLRDAPGDASAAPDLQRMTLSRASDGRLRAVLTLAAKLTPADLLAGSGPPGSVCLRLWTDADADPAAQRPDRLVCVTARSADELRSSVLEQEGKGLPRRTGSASVRLSASGRSLTVSVSQTALGRPARVRFAAEATRASCAQPSCTDTLPDAPATKVFRLR